jgi:hypothetical protein
MTEDYSNSDAVVHFANIRGACTLLMSAAERGPNTLEVEARYFCAKGIQQELNEIEEVLKAEIAEKAREAGNDAAG